MNTNRNRARRRPGSPLLALTMSLGLAACGSDDSSTATDATADQTTSSAPGRGDLARRGDQRGRRWAPPTRSSDRPATRSPPTATAPSTAWPPRRSPRAASANPLLSTLVTAVTKAGLVDTLNSAEGITVFAPVNDAFAAIPPKTLKAVLKDKATLTKILTHHVIAGQLSPDQLAGEHETLAGDTLTVTGSGEDFTVGAENGHDPVRQRADGQRHGLHHRHAC